MSANPTATASNHHSNRLVRRISLKIAIGIVLLAGCHSATGGVVANATVNDEPKANTEAQHDGKSVAEWIQQLENGSPVEHVRAIEALAILGRQSEPAWRKLLETLPSPEDPLADLHYTAMMYVAQPASDALLNRLREVDGNSFLMICRILDTVPHLPALDPDLLRKTCGALEFQNGQGASAIPSFLLHTQTEHRLLRTEVSRFYSSEFPQVRRACLQILGRLDNVSESLATFSVATDDKDQSVRLEAVLSLLKVYKQAPNPEVVVLLLKLLRDPDVVVCCQALHAVGQCDAANQVTEEALVSLASRLADAPWDASQLALRTMRTMGKTTPAVIPQLLPLLDQAKLMNVSNRSDAVIETLGTMGVPAIKPLVAAATDPDVVGRAGALRALQLLGADVDDAAAEKLQPLLKDESADIRVGAATALAHISGPKAVEAIPILIRQSHESETYGSMAEDALVRIGEPTIEFLKAELKANRSDSRPACSVLARLGSPGVPVLIDAVSNGPGGNDAIRHLGFMGPDAKAAVPVLIGKLQGEWTRRTAAEALTQIGPDARDAAPALRNGLQIDDPAFQMACAAGLVRIAATDPDIELGVEFIKSALSSADEWPGQLGQRRYQAYAALNQLGPTAERFIPELIAGLGDALGNYAVQILPRMNPAAVPALIQALDSDNEIIVTRAASCLGKMKAESGKAIPKLEAALGRVTSDWAKQEVRSAARQLAPESGVNVAGGQQMELGNLQRVVRTYIERLNHVQN